MAERNVENEAKAVDVLIDLWDETISEMAKMIVKRPTACVEEFSQHDIRLYLNKLNVIEDALKRLLTPLLKP